MKKYRCAVHNHGTNRVVEGGIPYCKYCEYMDEGIGAYKDKPNIAKTLLILWMILHAIWVIVYVF